MSVDILTVSDAFIGPVCVRPPDVVCALLGLDLDMRIEDVKRWIENGPKWDRLLLDAIGRSES